MLLHMAAGTRKIFVLNEAEVALLKDLARRMSCSEADIVRWGMAALEEVHRDGLRSATETSGLVTLEDTRSRVARFWQEADGTFKLGSRSGPSSQDIDGPPKVDRLR